MPNTALPPCQKAPAFQGAGIERPELRHLEGDVFLHYLGMGQNLRLMGPHMLVHMFSNHLMIGAPNFDPCPFEGGVMVN